MWCCTWNSLFQVHEHEPRGTSSITRMLLPCRRCRYFFIPLWMQVQKAGLLGGKSCGKEKKDQFTSCFFFLILYGDENCECDSFRNECMYLSPWSSNFFNVYRIQTKEVKYIYTFYIFVSLYFSFDVRITWAIHMPIRASNK